VNDESEKDSNPTLLISCPKFISPKLDSLKGSYCDGKVHNKVDKLSCRLKSMKISGYRE
jgi:hypothetical protein